MLSSGQKRMACRIWERWEALTVLPPRSIPLAMWWDIRICQMHDNIPFSGLRLAACRTWERSAALLLVLAESTKGARLSDTRIRQITATTMLFYGLKRAVCGTWGHSEVITVPPAELMEQSKSLV